jgi:hypothetical protein
VRKFSIITNLILWGTVKREVKKGYRQANVILVLNSEKREQVSMAQKLDQ